MRYTALGAVVLAGGGAGLAAASGGAPDGVLADDVKVAGMEWGGKSVEAARAELAAWSREREGETLTLRFPAGVGVNRVWKPSRAALGATVDVDATLAEAERVGRRDGALARLAGMFSQGGTAEIQPVWKVDEARVRKYLNDGVAHAVRRRERNARLLVSGGSFRVVPERTGRALDVAASQEVLLTALKADEPEPVELAVKTTAPAVTSQELSAIEGELIQFSTRYSERGNRERNIQIACEKINGTVLPPGGVFSYNDVVGPRGRENGFRMAPQIVRGRLVPGYGGGICQTSSTLYNAVLLGGLKVVKRSHHSFPVKYVPAGRDATVDYGSIDFQFENSTEAPIALAASASGGQCVVRIFGQKAARREVKIERTNIGSWGAGSSTIRDSSLAAGVTRTVDKGHSGHRVTVWRTFYENGQPVKREMVSRDVYRAFPRVVAVGTRASVRRTAARPAGTATTQSPPAATVPDETVGTVSDTP